MPVHLFGRPAPLEELAALGLPLIEDAAQAFGAPGVARTGVASTFSFYPTKNLFALGDGGLVAVNDEELARARAACCASTARAAKVDFELVGYNSRLDEIQAAALRIFLPHLDEWTALRREAAERYRELGLGELVTTPEDEPGHVYHLFVSRSSERDRIVAALREAEIGCATYYLPPLHLQPALRYLGYAGGLAARDREARARELLRAALGRDRRRAAGARRRRRAQPRSARRSHDAADHRGTGSGNLLADAVLIAVAWRLTFWLRFDQSIPPFYEHLLVVAGRSRSCVGDQARGLRRSSASTTAGGATSRRATCGAPRAASSSRRCSSTSCSTRSRRSTRRGCRAGSRVIDLLLLLAFVAGSRLLARTLIERPAPGGFVARGKEVLIVGAGDAGQLILREMQRNRRSSATRRSASSTTTRARRTCASTASACSGTTDELRARPARRQSPTRC